MKMSTRKLVIWMCVEYQRYLLFNISHTSMSISILFHLCGSILWIILNSLPRLSVIVIYICHARIWGPFIVSSNNPHVILKPQQVWMCLNFRYSKPALNFDGYTLYICCVCRYGCPWHLWSLLNVLTHLPRHKMAAVSQTTFSNACSWLKSLIFLIPLNFVA